MNEITVTASDGAQLAGYAWPVDDPATVLHIAHGMGEHARRYDWVAQQLKHRGIAVFAHDHRGHGATALGLSEPFGYMGVDGWNRVVADAYEVNRYLRRQYPEAKIVLLGHSMGASLAQQYVTRHGTTIDALILSGSPGFAAPSRNPLPRWILNFETRRHGAQGHSELMQRLLFGRANKPFESEGSTGSEWLSRDSEQVAAYAEDEQCGFVLSNGSLADYFAATLVTADPLSVAKIPKRLPTYVFSGTADPVHREQANVIRMVEAFRASGMTDVTLKWYTDGRHEMFNETNREEVMQDLLSWLTQRLSS